MRTNTIFTSGMSARILLLVLMFPVCNYLDKFMPTHGVYDPPQGTGYCTMLLAAYFLYVVVKLIKAHRNSG